MQLKNKNSDIFRLSKKYLGKGFTITVSQQPNRADYESNPDCQCKVFKYNHDDLFKNQQHRFLKGGSAFYSWKKYGTYTKTSGYPAWAASFVTEHLLETEQKKRDALYKGDQQQQSSYQNRGEASVPLKVFVIVLALTLFLIPIIGLLSTLI